MDVSCPGFCDEDVRVVDDLKVIGNSGEWSSRITMFGLQMIQDSREFCLKTVDDHDDDARVVDDFTVRVLPLFGL